MLEEANCRCREKGVISLLRLRVKGVKLPGGVGLGECRRQCEGVDRGYGPSIVSGDTGGALWHHGDPQDCKESKNFELH